MIHITELQDVPVELKWNPCKRIPVSQSHILMIESFVVETQHGTMVGRTGDHLMQGVKGELYICSGDSFDRCYET
jgi:hypothetical protein